MEGTLKNIILVFTLTFLSCTSSKPIDIKGKWYLYGSVKDGKTDKFNYKKYVEYDACTKKHYIQFNDSIFKQAKIDFHTCKEEHSLTGIYKIKENNITLIDKTEQFFEGDNSPVKDAKAYTLSFSVKGDKLIIKNKDREIIYVKLVE